MLDKIKEYMTGLVAYTFGNGSNDGGYRMYDLTNAADILSPTIKRFSAIITTMHLEL